MLDCFDDAKCALDENKSCGSTIASIIYFCTFYFFCTFLVSMTGASRGHYCSAAVEIEKHCHLLRNERLFLTLKYQSVKKEGSLVLSTYCTVMVL